MPEVAIDHAQAAADADRVARLVAALAQPAYADGRVDTVRRWLAWLEERGLVERYPPVAVLGAWVQALVGRPAAALRWADAVELGTDARAWPATSTALAERCVLAIRRSSHATWLIRGWTQSAGGPTARSAQMTEALPIVLVPGLLTSPRLYAEQLPTLWQHGPVTIADPTRDDTMAAIAGRILAHAPPRFALAGLSMGGYICFEITRQAPDRVARLALLDTSARPDTPELTRRRHAQIALARSGRFAEVPDQQFPLLIHPSRHGDAAVRELVRQMAEETGAEAFVRQQQAIIGRVDSRPGLGAIGCPTLVLVGDRDQLTPPELSAEIAGAIPGARLVVVADSGHLTPMDQPEEVTKALVEWLEA